MGEGDASTDGDVNAGFKGLEVSVMLKYGFFFPSNLGSIQYLMVLLSASVTGHTEYFSL